MDEAVFQSCSHSVYRGSGRALLSVGEQSCKLHSENLYSTRTNLHVQAKWDMLGKLKGESLRKEP